MKQARGERWGIKAYVPELVEHLSSPKMLCMEYCEGFKIKDQAVNSLSSQPVTH